VILVDANVLIYAHSDSVPQHRPARSWFEERLNEPGRLGLPWQSIVAFVRVVTNPRVFASPAPARDAWERVREWLACEPVWVPVPTRRHADVLGSLLDETNAVGNLVADAHLAALAIEHGLTLASTDGDFARFPGLSWQDPLAA
jgi:toxin-antitoxin system PIN domain toxin